VDPTLPPLSILAPVLIVAPVPPAGGAGPLQAVGGVSNAAVVTPVPLAVAGLRPDRRPIVA
jgi:hypothetical protein